MSSYTPPFFLQQFKDNSDVPLSGGKLYFYVAGSTTLAKDVYWDYALTNVVTQPLELDAIGKAPQYFMEDGLYKVVIMSADDVLIDTRDQVGQESSGGGSGTDSFKVKTNSIDTPEGYLQDKLLNSLFIEWEAVDVGAGNYKMVGNVLPDSILDGKIKTTNLDTPHYLANKIQDTSTIQLLIDPSSLRLKANFIGAAYVPATGGTYTGAVTFSQDTTFDGNIISNANITSTGIITGGYGQFNYLTTDNLNIAGLAGSAGLLVVDNAGNVGKSAYELGTVKYNDADTVAGYLATKIQAGSGIEITTTTDVVNGTVMHIGSITGNFMDTTSTPKSAALTIGSDTSILELDVINYLEGGTYQVIADLYVELTVTSGTAEIEAYAGANVDENPYIKYDGYTGYSPIIPIGFSRQYIHIDNLHYGFSGPSVHLNLQISGAFTGAIAWGHLTVIRIA